MAAASRSSRKPASRDTLDLTTTRALPFRLLKLTNLVSRPFFGQVAKQHELTLNEWRTLFVLASHPGISPAEISAHTGLQQMNISRAVASLRKTGRVSEAPDPRDLRRTLVSLTKAGVATYQAIAAAAREHNNQLFADIGAEQLAVFSDVLDALIQKAEALLQR